MLLLLLQVTSDKEKKLLFTVFDENRSWYFEENIKRNSEDPAKIDRNDLDFYNSNIMHSECSFQWLQHVKHYVIYTVKVRIFSPSVYFFW